MKNRCYSPKNPSFPNYGARGIRVCERWKTSFPSFVEDVGQRPVGHTLDRIDNDGDYEPGNVRWATRSTQRSNQRKVGDMQRRIRELEQQLARLTANCTCR